MTIFATVDNLSYTMNHSRKPGYYEASYICRNIKNYYQNFNVTVQYNKRISPESLSHALRNIILENQNFYTNFFRNAGTSADDDGYQNGRNFHVRPVESIRFADVVSFQTIPGAFNSACLENISFHLPPMNVEDPLWRVVVFEGPLDQYVTFYCDHALFDGTAGTQFHKDLIIELAKDDKYDHVLELLFSYVDDRQLLPLAMNDALEHTIDIFERPFWLRLYNYLTNSVFGRLYSKLLLFFKKSSRKTLAPLFQYEPVKIHDGYKYNIINFSKEEVKNLRKICKSEGFSITSYVGTVGIYSLQRTLFVHIPEMAKASSLLKISVNGRRFYPNDSEKLKYGVCVATFLEPFDYIKDLYATARLTNKKTKQNIATKSLFWTHGDALKRNNFWKIYGSTIGNYRRDTLYTSNLGLVDIKEKSWKASNIWFSQANGLMSHFVFSVVSSPEGGMNICLGYLPEYDNIEIGKKTIMEEFVEHFHRTALNEKIEVN